MIILHGDHQVLSRQFLLDLKKGKQIIEFLGSDLTLDKLSVAIETKSLFGEVNTVIIEGLFSQRNSQLKKDLINYLTKHSSDDIIIWEPKDVSSQVKDFKDVRKFDLPKHIFKFLDSPSLDNLHLSLGTMEPEIIFASLVTRAYKQQKLTWLKDLLEIEYKLKSGNLPYDLSTALELWCAKI